MLLPAEGLKTFLIIFKSLPVLLHPQINKRNKSKTMKIFLFLQKKKKKKKRNKERKKENKSKELLSKHHSQIMIITESLFNTGYIITYTKK